MKALRTFTVTYREVFKPRQWSHYGHRLRPYAERNFKGFVAVLYSLFKDQARPCDLIVGAGDSGSAMLALSRLAIERIGARYPHELRIPLQRYKDPTITWSDDPSDYFDNSVLLPDVRRALAHQPADYVLYVDDEISSLGLSVRTTLDLLLRARRHTPTRPVHFTVVGEDHSGFDMNPPVGVEAEFFAVAQGVENLFSVV